MSADHFGLKQDGPSIGDNVGNAIYARSGNGIVYNGAVRDINGLNDLPNFTSFVRYYDPSHHFGSLASGRLLNSTMVSINGPTRIGDASSCRETWSWDEMGASFSFRRNWRNRSSNDSERTHLEDMFGHQRLRERSTPPDRSMPGGRRKSKRTTTSG